jgi:hypothetical protein
MEQSITAKNVVKNEFEMRWFWQEKQGLVTLSRRRVGKPSLIFADFFTVFEYSPIGVKFPPITAPHTLYTVKKKKKENFQIILSFES